MSNPYRFYLTESVTTRRYTVTNIVWLIRL
nr:MAG TPA: hypothetical protein [Caudoviricetes sp.]